MPASVPLLVAVNGFGGLIFGYLVVGISSPIGFWWPCWYNEVDIHKETSGTTWEMAIVTAVVNVGAGIGAIAGGPLVNKIGRKKGIALSGVITALGHAGSCFGVKYALQIIARIVLGVGAGISTAACPAYVAEMAPDKYRGALNSLFQVMITVGIFLANLIGYFVAGSNRDITNCQLNGQDYTKAYMYCTQNMSVTDPSKWHSTALVQNLELLVPGLIIPLMLVVTAFIIPESTKWLAQQGEEAPLKLETTEETEIIGQQSGSIGDLFTIHTKAAVTGFVLCCALQLTGINAVMFYSTAFFKGAGIKEVALASTFLMFWNSITTLVSLFLVDRAGRRLLLIPSVFILSLSIIGLDIVTPRTEDNTADICHPAPLVPSAPTPPAPPGPMPSTPSVTPTPPPSKLSNDNIHHSLSAFDSNIYSHLYSEMYASNTKKMQTQSVLAGPAVAPSNAAPGAPSHMTPATPGPPTAPPTPTPPTPGNNNKVAAWRSALSITFLAIYIACFEIGPGSLFWVLVNEIFEPSIASTAAGIFNALSWIFTLLITLTFPPLQHLMNANVFLLFGIPGILCSVYLFLCLPETAGKDVATISQDMQSRWIVLWGDSDDGERSVGKHQE